MAENTIPMTLDGQAYEKKKASQIIARLALIQSGGHGARTRNPLRGTTFPVALRADPPSSTIARSRTPLRFCGDGQIPPLSASIWRCPLVWLQTGYTTVRLAE